MEAEYASDTLPKINHPCSQRRYRVEVYEDSSTMEVQTIRIIITSTPWPLDIAITPTETSADRPELRSSKIQ